MQSIPTVLQLPSAAAKPTMYFIGVTTGRSSIMNLFPLWSEALGIDACIKGIDLPIHAPEEDYRKTVEFIKNDTFSMGALVTTHKLDMYNAVMDLFDYRDPYAEMFGELSSISKKDGKFCAHAKDPISCGLAMEAFIPEGRWKKTGAQACILGAGGSALSISAYLAQEKHGDDIPSYIHLVNRSAPRLAEAVMKLKDLRVPMVYHLCSDDLKLNDAVVENLPEGSFVVNATGLGKDRPGSPLSDACRFPKEGIVWELNYRGSLEFLHQAEAQKDDRNLLIEDGWTYFIHGWTQVIAQVFHMDITGDRLAICDRIARGSRMVHP